MTHFIFPSFSAGSMCPILLLVLLLVIFTVDAHLYKATAGKQRQDVDIWTGVVDVPGKCATMCLMNNDCWSFNVMENNGELTCQLNGGHGAGILADVPQSLYYGEKHFVTLIFSIVYLYSAESITGRL